MTGKMPVNAKNASRKEQANKSGLKSTTANGVSQMNKAQTEEERLQAMFQVQNEQWSGQLEEMAK
jgi:protein MPE1